MKLIHLPWVFVLVTVLLGEVHAASSDGLSSVDKVALDQLTQYPDGMPVKALYVGFGNNHSVFVQLWEPSGNESKQFSLVWQKEVRGINVDGKPEVIPLEKEIVVNASLRVGIQNTNLPGPIDGVFKSNGGLRLSKDRSSDTVKTGHRVEFDSLLMPRSFAIRLCNTSDCYYMMKHAPKPPRVMARKEAEEDLLSRGMIIALIAWNIAITFVLLIVIIAVIWVCVVMDNSKSQRRRRDNLARGSQIESRAYDNIEEPNNGIDQRWQTSDSWKPDSGMDTIDTTDEQKLTDEKSAL